MVGESVTLLVGDRLGLVVGVLVGLVVGANVTFSDVGGTDPTTGLNEGAADGDTEIVGDNVGAPEEDVGGFIAVGAVDGAKVNPADGEIDGVVVVIEYQVQYYDRTKLNNNNKAETELKAAST